MTKYEFVYILDPSLDEAAAGANFEKYMRLVKDQGGEVAHQESWGRKKLAYEIDKKNEGSYFYARLMATAAVVSELNRQLRYDEQVMRTLIVRDEDWAARNEAAGRRSGPRQKAPAPAPAA
jgi:small subunit ribosomal protein S6